MRAPPHMLVPSSDKWQRGHQPPSIYLILRSPLRILIGVSSSAGKRSVVGEDHGRATVLGPRRRVPLALVQIVARNVRAAVIRIVVVEFVVVAAGRVLQSVVSVIRGRVMGAVVV